MHRLKRLFISGIEEIKTSLAAHIELSQESLAIVGNLIQSRNLSKTDIDEVMRKITALEREGDEIVRLLVDKVTQGSVVPTVTNVVLILLDNADNILDMIYFAIKEIKRGYHLWNNDFIYDIINNYVREILDLVKTMIEYFRNMLNTKNYEELVRYARIISSLEEEIDEIKENILDKVYSVNLTAVEFNHITSLIYTVDKIADNIQDAAYHLVTIMSSL